MIHLENLPEALDETPAPDASAAANDRASVLLGLVERLPENQREVVRLKFLHGLSYRDISAATRLSESNVGFLLHTALKTLRQRASLPSALDALKG